MQVYKRSVGSLIKSLILAPFAGVAVFVVLYILLQFVNFGTLGVYLLYGVPVFAFLWMLYASIFSENIRVEIDPAGTCRYFKNNKLMKQWLLPQCQVGYYKRTESGLLGNNNIRLDIRNEMGQDETVDCSPLGSTQFYNMFAHMETFTKPEPQVQVLQAE
jgi:hypothetical protein